MLQVLLKKGRALVEHVPAPQLEKGSIIVQVVYSCISAGTEVSSLRMSGEPLWRRALKQPENVKKVLSMLATSGFEKTKSVITGQLAAGSPTGYSAAGYVIAVGEGVDDIKIGDRVACAGAQCAHHAEFIRIPRNLLVPIPDSVNFADASTVTLGAIALQGVRRANPTLGETFVVVGLGILGQLTQQLLQANGCKVIGIDLDASRIELAKQHGMSAGAIPGQDEINTIQRLTHAIGADGVIITAANTSNEIISTAFRMCRKKGRVVLVGDVGLSLNRADFYTKEIDFFISCSYGPGRYDQNYEELGLDYPVGYVRWTENRNMNAYLDLLAENKITLQALIAKTFPIEDASNAYETINSASSKPLIVLLQYPDDSKLEYQLPNVSLRKQPNQKQVRLAIVGAGGFAKGMHLPNLAKLKDKFFLNAIVSRSGHNAVATAKQFEAKHASTDYESVLTDPEVDAVLIATRHNQHAAMVLAALKANKHVLVEKPLALTDEELQSIVEWYQIHEGQPVPLLLTGFNRRFSPAISCLTPYLKQRTNPMIINYRMNAGYIPREHWVHGIEGGGRNRGEACHIYDLFTFLTQSKVTNITATAISPQTQYYHADDNFIATFSFADGSMATLTYTALGNSNYPKEHMEIFVDGQVFNLTDYKQTQHFGKKNILYSAKTANKGQEEELLAFYSAIKDKETGWPIPLWQQVQATQMANTVENIIKTGG